MAEYKIIFKAGLKAEGNNALTWEPGCPALVTAIQVSRNTETSATYLQVKVRNVSDAAISSIFAGLEVNLPNGSVERVPLEYLDVDIPAGEEQALKPMMLSHNDISSCVLAISRIDQVSGKWQTSTAAQPLPEKKTPPQLPQRAIDQRARALDAKAEDEVVRGAVQDHGDWWVCACGQVNVKRDTCCACKQSKALLLANEDESKLLADVDAFDEQTYNEAVKLQEEDTASSLKKAASKFEAVGNYKEAEKHLAECKSKIESSNNKRHKLAIITAIVAAAIVVAACALAVFAIGFSYDRDFFVNSKWETSDFEIGDDSAALNLLLTDDGEIEVTGSTNAELQSAISTYHVLSGGKTISLGNWKYESNTLTFEFKDNGTISSTASSAKLPIKFSSPLEITMQVNDSSVEFTIKKTD